jgi:hypothetical protein
MLSIEDYSCRLNSRDLQFGASLFGPWEVVFSGTRTELSTTRQVLEILLDSLVGVDLKTSLEKRQADWTAAQLQKNNLQWRYYLVHYSAMREGRSGIYASPGGSMGFSICMLDGVRVSGRYRDAYLYAIYCESKVGSAVQYPLFMGYETIPRWLHLNKSGTELRCVDTGFQLKAPLASAHQDVFVRVCKTHSVGDDLLLKVPKNNDGSDAKDRIEIGAAFLKDLVASGL